VRRGATTGNYTPPQVTRLPEVPFYTHIYPGDADNTFYAACLELQGGDGRRDVGRLSVDESGVKTDGTFLAMQLGSTGFSGVQTSNILFDANSVLTSAGEQVTPDLRAIHGTFFVNQSYAASGIPISFLDRGQVAYVHNSRLTNSAAITVFDAGSFVPQATLPIPLDFSSAVRAGDSSIAVLTPTEILFVPLSAVPTWPDSSFTLTSLASGVRRVNFPVSSMTAVKGTSTLIVSTPSTAGTLGNRILFIDGQTGTLQGSVYAGSEPQMLRISGDQSSVYTYLQGERRIARVDLVTRTRDLLFATDPTGGSQQYPIYDMDTGAGSALAVSYFGGGIAVFDAGVLRQEMDRNNEGTGAFLGGTYELEFDGSGTTLYARETTWSSAGFKRCSVDEKGVRWLSSADGLIGGSMHYAEGLLYTSFGSIFDPERSRVIGTLPGAGQSMLAEPSKNRAFSVNQSVLHLYELSTRSLVGSLPLPYGQTTPSNLALVGQDEIAFLMSEVFTGATTVYLASISAIPQLAAPVTVAQPSLPQTPGVIVIDLKVNDLAYDPQRDLIWTTIPNSEAANGDRLAAIDPATGNVVQTYPAGLNPNLIAIPEDASRVYYSAGASPIGALSGFSRSPETVRVLYPASGEMGAEFPARPPASESTTRIGGLASLPGKPGSVAVLDYVSQSVGGGVYTSSLQVLRTFDEGVPLPNTPPEGTFSCSQMVAAPSRLYCFAGVMYRFSTANTGVHLLDSFRLLPGRASFGPMAYAKGRVYTTGGLILDPEGKRNLARLEASGPVAVSDGVVYWLEGGTYPGNRSTLRSFNADTLAPIGTREINVSTVPFGRLIHCGRGRLAFQAGKELYIVQP